MALQAPNPTAASRLNARPVTLAVIVGNRGFFPAHLALSGRKTILEVLEKAGINAIITPEDTTNVGAVESLQEARQTAELLKRHRDDIDGVLVTLPNFGDERAIANTLRIFLGADPLVDAIRLITSSREVFATSAAPITGAT